MGSKSIYSPKSLNCYASRGSNTGQNYSRDDWGYTKDSFEDFQKESILSSYKLLSQSLMAAS